MREALNAWYDRNISAAWYRASSLIVGWLTAAAVFLPDVLQFLADNWGAISGVALPTLAPEHKAIILAVYIAFVAPPLRAWKQRKMQEAALTQAAKTGVIRSDPGTDAVRIEVPGTAPVEVVPMADSAPQHKGL